jgi:hypothetical protein
MANGSGVSRGDKNRNARLSRLRELVPTSNAIVGIDLADSKQDRGRSENHHVMCDRIGTQTVVLARGVRDERSRYSPKKKAISSSQLLQGTGSSKGAGNGAPGTATLPALNSLAPAVPKCTCSWCALSGSRWLAAKSTHLRNATGSPDSSNSTPSTNI